MRRTPVETFRIILFAADFSRNSREAFRLACSLAIENKTRVIVVNVDEPTLVGDEPAHFPAASAVFPETGKQPAREAAIAQRLRELYRTTRQIDLEYRVEQGEPATAILRLAVEVGANVIAMGTHGRRGLDRLMTGSVATSVLRGADCPVLALRAVPGAPEAGEILAILHPTDFSQNSERARLVARSLASELGTRLIILHVAAVQALADGTAAAEVDPRTDRDALDDVRKRLDGPDLKYPIEIRLCRGFDREEIIQVAKEVGCGLIVMGTHGRTALGRLLMGSVAESVMNRANCPVLIVKQGRVVPAPTEPRPAQESVTII
jgi:nucleotide-binding universal stress UspA family protein